MHPVMTIPLFGVAIQSYSLFTVLGALAFTAVALPLLLRAGVRPLRALCLMVLMAAAFLVGARLWNYAINPAAYGSTLLWYSFRLAGLSMYGGLLGSAIVLILWARFGRTRILPLLDALTLPSAFAFALARVGCFLNGCCYGVPTSGVLGVVFPLRGGAQETLDSMLSMVGMSLATARYPTQLFELALALIGLVPALMIGKKMKTGSVFLLYGIWFSAFRLTILPLRSLPYEDLIVNAVYPALYITLISIGVAVLIFVNKEATQAKGDVTYVLQTKDGQ